MNPNALFDDIEPKKRRSQPWRVPPRDAERHNVLFSGLACLPGQLDLFATDGATQEPDRGLATTRQEVPR